MLPERATILCTLILVLVLGTAPMQVSAQGRGTSSVYQDKVAEAVVVHAMAYQLRKTKDPGLLAEQFFSLKLYREGKGHNEIVDRTMAKRREWGQLRQAALTGEWSASEKAKTVTRAFGRIATQLFGAGSTGVEAANLGILYYEDWIGGKTLHRAAYRLAEEYAKFGGDLQSPENSVLQQVLSAYRSEEYQKAWNTLFKPLYGFTPAATITDVLKNYPEFEQHVSLIRMLDGTVNIQSALEQIEKLQRKLDNVTTTARSDNAKDLGDIKEHWAKEAEHQEERRRQDVLRIEREGYRSAGNLVATMVGLSDPTLGRQIRSVNQTLFRVGDAFTSYRAALKTSADPNLVALTLTGNVVGAGVSLLATFMDTGPTADEVILRSIADLSRQVQRVREEMHARFDDMHVHLDKIYVRMDGVFDALKQRHAVTKEDLRQVHNDLQGIRRTLRDATELDLDTQSIVYRTSAATRGLLTGLTLKRCLRTFDPGNDPMTMTRFNDCLADFEAIGKLLADSQLKGVGSDHARVYWLASAPEETVALSLTKFADLSSEQWSTPAGPVVGPRDWFSVANLHGEFVGNYPRLAATSEHFGEGVFARQATHQRDTLRLYAKAIQKHLQASQAGEESAFGKLFSETWNDADAKTLRSLVERAYKRYYADLKNPSFRVVRMTDDEVEPEVRFEMGLEKAWAPMKDFYVENDVPPDWVLINGNGCGDDDRVKTATEPVKIAMAGDGIESFVNPMFVKFARLGLGKIKICATMINVIVERRRAQRKGYPLDVLFARQELANTNRVRSLQFDISAETDVNELWRSWRRRRVAEVGKMGWLASLSKGASEGYRRQQSDQTDAVPGGVIRRSDSEAGVVYGTKHVLDLSISYIPKHSTKAVEIRQIGIELGETWNELWSPNPKEIAAIINKKVPPGGDKPSQELMDVYKDHYYGKQKATWEYVRKTLKADEGFQAMERKLALGNLYVRSWLGLSFDKVKGRSGVLSAITAGRVGFPRLTVMLEGSTDDRLPGRMAAKVTKKVEEFMKVLASERMRDVAKYGYGHRILTEMRFENIDG